MGGVVERLGHVLGWTGTGLAALSLLAGVVAVGADAWDTWNAKPVRLFELTSPDGSIYAVVGDTDAYRAQEDAANAVKQFRGEQSPELMYHWKIYKTSDQSPEAAAQMKSELNAIHAEKMTELWKKTGRNAMGTMALAAFGTILFYLFGRAARYVLAGSAPH